MIERKRLRKRALFKSLLKNYIKIFTNNLEEKKLLHVVNRSIKLID